MEVILSQYGLMVIFLSALIGASEIFWSSKVRYNRELAESQIDKSEHSIRELVIIHKQLRTDMSESIAPHLRISEAAKLELEKVDGFPKYLNFSGKFSILVLGFGTLMCVVGAG